MYTNKIQKIDVATKYGTIINKTVRDRKNHFKQRKAQEIWQQVKNNIKCRKKNLCNHLLIGKQINRTAW